MTVTLTTFLTASALLGAFVVLFRVEEVKGSRVFLSGLRGFFDRLLEQTTYKLSHLSLRFGSGVFRLVFHYIVHRFLNVVLGILRALEGSLYHLQNRNRVSAKSVRPRDDKTHLDIMVEHKERNTLSEADKQKLKDKSISGE